MKSLLVPTLCVFLFLLAFSGQAQELIRQTSTKDGITERFLVLKSDKAMRQGQYLKSYSDGLYTDYVVELGQYEQNQKAGTWISFYHRDPKNFVKSAGDYKDGKKEGTWTYFYRGETTSLLASLGSERRTGITKPRKGTLEYQVAVDISGHQVSATGDYQDDRRTGVWEFYTPSGKLAHKYDYSTNALVGNYVRMPDNAFIAFLGGIDRFLDLYNTVQYDMRLKSPVSRASEVTYEVEKGGGYKLVKKHGDEAFIRYIDWLMQAIPPEWVYLDADSEKKLHVIYTAAFPFVSASEPKFNLSLKFIE